MAQIQIPAGSSTSALQTAINNAESGDILVLNSNITLQGPITIPAGKSITIQSDSNWTLGQNTSLTPHFNILNGAGLILQGITINSLTTAGGIMLGGAPGDISSLTIQGGTNITNCVNAISCGPYGTVTMSDGTITGSVQGCIDNKGLFILNGGTIHDNICSRDGGAIANSGYLIINGGTIESNSNHVTNAQSFSGGAIYNEGMLTINGGTFSGNEASGHGGAIYSTTPVTVTGGIFTGNSALAFGGAIYLYDTELTASNATFSKNTAMSGGGIYGGGKVSGGEIHITNCVFTENIAQYKQANSCSGGAILTANALYVKGTSFTGNQAEIGGAIYCTTPYTVEVSGASSFDGNSAAADGGAIYLAIYSISAFSYSYEKFSVALDTVFSNNSAVTLYNAPAKAATLLPQIGGTSDHGFPVNNYDIYPLLSRIEYIAAYLDETDQALMKNFSGQSVLTSDDLTVISPADAGFGDLYKDCTVLGWSTEYIDGNDTLYQQGDSIIANIPTVNLLTSLAVGVTYDSNDGTNTSFIAPNVRIGNFPLGIPGESPDSVTDRVALLSETGFSRDGYRFFAWSTTADGKGTLYAPGVPITLKGNTTLYAIWNETVSVTYDANGGSGSPYTDQVILIGESDTVLSANSAGFSREGYKLTGWSRTATDPIGYLPGDFITPAADETLYAQWMLTAMSPAAIKKQIPADTGTTADRKGYAVKDPLTYTLQYKLPSDLSGIETVIITDTFDPVDAVAILSSSVNIDGSITHVQTGGVLTWVINSAVLQGHAGEDIVITLRTQVQSTAFPITSTMAVALDTVEGAVLVEPVQQGDEAAFLYKVQYEGDAAATGTPPDDAHVYTNGASITILGRGGLQKDGYSFLGWNLL